MWAELVLVANLAVAGIPESAFDSCAAAVAKWWSGRPPLPQSAVERAALGAQWGDEFERGELRVGFGMQLRSLGSDADSADDDLVSLYCAWWSDALYSSPARELWDPPHPGKVAQMFDLEAGRIGFTTWRMSGIGTTLQLQSETGSGSIDRESFARLSEKSRSDGWGRPIEFDPVLFVFGMEVDLWSLRALDEPTGEPRWRAYRLEDRNATGEESATPRLLIGDRGSPLTVKIATDFDSEHFLVLLDRSSRGRLSLPPIELGRRPTVLEFGKLVPGPLWIGVARSRVEQAIASRTLEIPEVGKTEVEFHLIESRLRVITEPPSEESEIEVRIEELDGTPLAVKSTRCGEIASFLVPVGTQRLIVLRDGDEAFSEEITFDRREQRTIVLR